MRDRSTWEDREATDFALLLADLAAEATYTTSASLTPAQAETLLVVGTRDPMTISELANELDRHPSTTSRRVDHLVDRRLLGRGEDPCDRRRVLVSMTPEGRRVIDTFEHHLRARITSIVDQIPSEHHPHLTQAARALQLAAHEHRRTRIAEVEDP